ncbi:MAG: hypothetical protein JSS86_09725 [Cyanobacteria bacterium SZAS LIN-2]|nr:hypothetical protein [Cyanobacteria bacterium SZAS LIN-3]MBS1996579.1 hypothetical protein [Cyanobacteria bacterium SZAS LIN-2]
MPEEEKPQAEQEPQAQPQTQPQYLPGQAPVPDYPVRIHSRRRAQAEQPATGDIYAVQHPAVISQPVQPQPAAAPPARQEDQVFEIQPFEETAQEREQAYIKEQEARLAGEVMPGDVETPPAKVCRHEYVRIFQRKLKDLNRRMVCTKAYLPVGFKMGDFSHLGENSFCFCATCRVRLYPKRSQAEKAEARIQLAQGKALKLEMQQSATAADLIEEVGAKALAELLMRVEDEDEGEQEEVEDENVPKVDIHVEELEQEVVGVEDIDVESLKANQEEESCELLDQEEM